MHDNEDAASSVAAQRWDGAVLVVEPLAHLLSGHFPKRFAELADGFAEAGAHVEVLTSQGWALRSTVAARWPMRQFGALAGWMFTQAATIRSIRGREVRVLRRSGTLIRTAILALETRRAAGKSSVQPVAIVVVTGEANPAVFALVAGKRPVILHHAAPGAGSFNTEVARAAHRFRMITGRPQPRVTLAVPDASLIATVEAELPGLAGQQLLLAGCRAVSETRAAARRALGIDQAQSVALLFGGGHSSHDPTTVFTAFRDRPDWLLIVSGKVARHADEHAVESWVTRPLVFGGFVDPAFRERVYAAADVSLLSFHPGYRRNSGTLMDAISHGRGVIASDHSFAADLVKIWGMGTVFPAGSAEGLSLALDSFDAEASRLGALAAQVHLSNKAVAVRHLETFARLGF